MNLLLFLKPKQEVCVVAIDATLRQAIEKLRTSGYAAVPVIDANGVYCGTVTEGDILFAVLNEDKPKAWERIPLSGILRKGFNPPVSISANIDDLFQCAVTQNFVPVVDDRNMFIGIITRQDILRYFASEHVRA